MTSFCASVVFFFLLSFHRGVVGWWWMVWIVIYSIFFALFFSGLLDSSPVLSLKVCCFMWVRAIIRVGSCDSEALVSFDEMIQIW